MKDSELVLINLFLSTANKEILISFTGEWKKQLSLTEVLGGGAFDEPYDSPLFHQSTILPFSVIWTCK